MTILNRRGHRQQGFVLLFVVLLSAAIVTAAGTVAMTAEVESRTANRNVKGVQALAIAYAGLQRALKTTDLAGSGMLSALNDFLDDGSPASLSISGTVFHPWPSGVNDLRPGGTSYALGDGRYKLYLLDDPEERDNDPTADSNLTLRLRSFGWVVEPNDNNFGAEALVEFSYRIPLLASFPGAFVACFEDPTTTVWFGGEMAPGFPYMSWRVDGSQDTAGTAKPAILSSADEYRMNGFSIIHDGENFANKWMFRDNAVRPTASYQNGGPFFTWYGWTDTAEPAGAPASANGSENVIDEGFASTDIAIGDNARGVRPLGLEAVPKRIIGKNKIMDPTYGTAVNSNDITYYKTPIIALGNGLSYGLEKAEVDFEAAYDYAGNEDNRAKNGFYGCPNSSYNDQYEPVGECLSATPSNSTGLFGALSSAPTVNYSGLAWNVLQTVLRECKGSGAGATCATGYEAFENIAKCLILPANVKRDWAGLFGDTVGDVNVAYQDIIGAGGATADTAPNSVTKSWWPYYYKRITLDETMVDGWSNNVADETLAKQGFCQTSYPAGWIVPPQTPYYTPGANCTASDDPASPTPCGRVLVKYCNPATYQARAVVGGVWDWVSCDNPVAWTAENCDDGYSMSTTDLLGITAHPGFQAGFCDDDPNATPPCAGSGSAGDYIADIVALGAPLHKELGDFTECAPGCAFKWDPTPGNAIPAGTSNVRTYSGSNHWRSVCINMDAFHVHNYGPADSPTQRRGERGSMHFISRLDMSDDGPLGSCNHASADHRILKDRGTCLTGGRDNFYENGVTAPVFTGTYTSHPGANMTALFSRTADHEDSWLPATKTPTSFCPASTMNADAAELFALLDEMLAFAADADEVGAGSLSSEPTPLWTDGEVINGLDGAICEYSADVVNGNKLGWFVKSCPAPGIYKGRANSSINGVICGCGLLGTKLSGAGKLRLDMNNTKEALVWRGLLVFLSEGNGTEISVIADGTGDKILYVDGGFLTIMTGAARSFRVYPQYRGDAGEPHVYIRFNQAAITEALGGLDIPVRGFRIVY